MVVPRLIERKRDGAALTGDEWRALIDAYAAGTLPDYQMAALAMAVVFRGLTTDETAALTDAMVGSGDRLRLGDLPGPRIDKHSTGGIGDKTSLLLVPMLAACGVVVPMMSGRGLGHTGGTLDKLEAIPGFRTDLDLRRAEGQLRTLGAVMIGQTAEIAPADRKLYALRDVTGTVESIPLISASIMSKKLAEDLTGLVLDVKIGSGAFLPEPERAIDLARTMIALGEARGCPTVALVTAMDRPLGVACGNALEVAEAIAGLRGDGPTDLMAVTYALGAEMLLLAGLEKERRGALQRLRRTITDGSALELFRALVEAQGGDPAVVDAPARLPVAPVLREVGAERAGVVVRIEPRPIGWAIIGLGGGRAKVGDTIDPAVGVEVLVRPGQRVTVGEPLVRIHARTEADAEAAAAVLRDSIPIGEHAPDPLPLIAWRVTGDGAVPYGTVT